MRISIPKPLCSLSYITVDTAIAEILKLGTGTLLAKVDVKSAFRLLPVHPADCHLLAMNWNAQIFIDTCLLRSAPKLFNILADLLSWILEQKGVYPLRRYLDDFLLISPPKLSACSNNLQIILKVCSHLGIPLVTEKIKGPTKILTFLGITLDTQNMEARFDLLSWNSSVKKLKHGSKKGMPKRGLFYHLLVCYNMPQKLSSQAGCLCRGCTQQ